MNLSKETSNELLEAINNICCKENNVEFDANGDTLYSFGNLLSVVTEALTNPLIIKSANLYTLEDCLGFAEWVVPNAMFRLEGKWWYEDKFYTTQELFTLYLKNKTT